MHLHGFLRNMCYSKLTDERKEVREKLSDI